MPRLVIVTATLTALLAAWGEGAAAALAAPTVAKAGARPAGDGDAYVLTTARDIYVRAMAGINGTPMPESADVLTPEQVWQVAHYVQALGGWPGSTPELRQFAAQLPP